jgi:drug/metabolite transporter (DMT)-like permease
MILGIVFAFLTAFVYALSVVYVRKRIEESDFLSVAIITTVVGLLALSPLAIIMANSSFSIVGALIFLLGGLLYPGLSRLVYFKGIEKVGVCTMASIWAGYPMFSTLLAVVLLGESPSTSTLAGVVCVVLGSVLVQSNVHSNEVLKKTWLLIPFSGAVVMGLAYVVKKIGLNFYADPITGVALAYLSALLFYLVLLGSSRSVRMNVCIDKKSLGLFWKAGLGMCIGGLFSFYALSYGDVSFVVPLIQTEPILVFVITHFYLKGVEAVSWRLVVGAVSTILGITLITIF